MIWGPHVEHPVGRCSICLQWIWPEQDYQADAMPGQEPMKRHLLCMQVWGFDEEEEATG